jgi:hypothetical protein
MPNRKQIIIFSVLGIVAFLAGYFKDSINISIGKRAEIQGPVPSTIVITNTVPVQPKPNPAKPKANPVKPTTIFPKDIVGTYERKSGTNTFRNVFLDNGTREYYNNGEKLSGVILAKVWLHGKWSIVDNEIHIKYPNNFVIIYSLNPDNSLTKIAYIENGKRTDLTKEQEYTYKKIK